MAGRPGLVFYYPELLAEGLPEPLRKYDKVEIKVEKDDKWCFGCNNLSLDEKTVVAPLEYERVAVPPEQTAAILRSKIRTARVPSAPPQGLFLWRVWYRKIE